MTQLSKLAVLGIGKESGPGVYAAPTAFIPFQKADFEDQFTDIKDESYRGNDTTLQGLYQGQAQADWSIDLMAYPDIGGYFLRGMIGPDTVTPGVATTLSTATAAGATTVTTAASIPALTYISIDTAANQEYALVTAVTGSGPYTLTVTGVAGQAVGLTKAHASGVAVQGTTMHTFKQSSSASSRATFTLSIYDTVSTISYAGFAIGGLDIKIDPKDAVTFAVKGTSFNGVPASPLTPSYATYPPALGWQWQMTNGGATSTRGLSLDLKMARDTDVIHSSDGTISPREIFQGAFGVEGSYKAIFENSVDMDLFTNYVQTPTVARLQQPVAAGGSALAFTMSRSGWYKGKRDFGNYVEAQFTIAGIYNALDGGAIQASLTNFVTTAY